jgi:uncharacterized protein (DUF1778 family)
MCVREQEAMATKTRELRWNFRVAASDDALIRAASDARETSLTSFVREAALSEARRVLADRRHYSLPTADWHAFCELLERPPEVPVGLKDLYSKPSVFE